MATGLRERMRALLLEARRAEHVEHGSGATEAKIAAAECAIGVRFPASYREFLKQIGWMDQPTFGVAGVGDDVPRHLDVVQMTLDERTEFRPFIPLWLIPIWNNGAGDHYCIDTAHLVEDRAAIVFWAHELDEGQTPVWEAGDLLDWLRQMLDDM